MKIKQWLKEGVEYIGLDENGEPMFSLSNGASVFIFCVCVALCALAILLGIMV